MDEDTRKVAKEKASAMLESIGYPNYLLNDTSLYNEYVDLIIDERFYFSNALNITSTAAVQVLVTLRKKRDKEKWPQSAAYPNAYYSSTNNQIMFPAGILQVNLT